MPERVSQSLRRLYRLFQEYPISNADLWHSERTSQISAIKRSLGADVLVGVLTGGNRSGKTEAGAQLAVAFALGSEHPAVQVWAKRNGLDVSAIQPGPGTVCCSSLTSNESKRIQRKKVETYLPMGTDWSNKNGNGEAVARLPGGGLILFKSNDQGERSFQGDEWDLLWMDEEHDERVFNEGRMRLADRAGRALFTMTPLKGRTWVWKRFVSQTHDQYEGDCVHYAINSRDNPHVPQWYMDKLLSKYGTHERATREHGAFVVLEGRVYPDFWHDLHVVESFRTPDDWERVASIDFGTRNPTAILLGAIDPSDDTLHIIDEHYMSEWTLRQHAVAYRRMISQHPDPIWFVADPADRGARLSLAREHDIQTIAAKKRAGSVRDGINAVAERLAPDVEGRPHLLIHDRCRHTIREIEGYVWSTSSTKNDLPDAPRKKDDHAMDALAYMCSQLTRSTFGVA